MGRLRCLASILLVNRCIMALTLEQFVQQLSASGLVTPDEAKDLAQRSAVSDAEQFAKLLVKQKTLTAYQAQQLYAGKGRSLVLGNYVLLDKLGQGGMGMVLKAAHRRMKRTVALKVLSPAVGKSPELVARFHREVEAAAKLSHPNIVTAYDADEAGGTSFLVMEYVDGKDLASVVKSQGPLSLAQVCKCVIQAAKGLEYAHNQRIIHRDIKPANLLIDRQGTVKILDMGLARMDAEPRKTELTSTGAVMGTVDYMAPEQALSSKHADARSDIYSLGITLWYLLTAKPAYDGDSMMARLLGHRESVIPSLVSELSRRPAGAKPIPAEKARAIDAIFQKMVAKKPEERYQTMAEVIRALEAIPTAGESIAMLGGTDPEATVIGAQLSSPDATAGRQATIPAAAATATVKKAHDEDLIPGSPFAATVNTGNEQSPTATMMKTGPRGGKDVLPKVGKAKRKSGQGGSKGPNRTWMIAGGAGGGLLLLGVIIITITNKDGTQTKIEVPDDSKVEVTTAASPSSTSKPAVSPVAAKPVATEQTGWEWLIGPGVDGASVWNHLDPFRIENGELQVDKDRMISTKESYDDFELEFEWKLGPKGNSGVKYRTDGAAAGTALSYPSPEMQLIDPAGFPNLQPKQSTGALWSAFPPSRDAAKPPGEWNTGKVLARGNHVEHWINGEKVVEYEVGSPEWEQALGTDTPLRKNSGRPDGNILLQGHVAGAAFRNMRIRRLEGIAGASKGWIDLAAHGVDTSARWEKLGPFRFDSGQLTARSGGLAVSSDLYDDFELQFDWKVSEGGNSGVYYRTEVEKVGEKSAYQGTEYQLLDPKRHPNGQDMKTTAGSLYGVIAVTRDASRPAGEWNSSRIVANGPHVEHWLNGEKVVEYDMDSPAWQESLQSVKGEHMRANVTSRRGNILLQGHSGEVSIRNMRVRRLESTTSPTGKLHAVRFEGPGQYVQTGSKLSMAQPWTVEVWVTPEEVELPENESRIVFGTESVLLAVRQSNGRPKWILNCFGGAAAKGQLWSSKPVEFGRRSHVAGVYDGENILLFVNGDLQGSTTVALHDRIVLAIPFPTQYSSRIPAPGEPMNGNGFHGSIDEARVSQAAEYQKSFVPPDELPLTPETVVLYHCDEGKGQVLNDASKNKTPALIMGATWTTISFSERIPASRPNAGDFSTASGWIDLLASVVPSAENSRGEWTRTSGGTLSAAGVPGGEFPELSFDPRPSGSYEVEAGVILQGAHHAIIHLPAGSGTASLILSRRAEGVVWQTSGSFDPGGQPAAQKLKFEIQPDVEASLRIKVDVNEAGDRARLSGTVNGQALPVLDHKTADLVRISLPPSLNIPPPKWPTRSFAFHVGMGQTATLTRFRYRDSPGR